MTSPPPEPQPASASDHSHTVDDDPKAKKKMKFDTQDSSLSCSRVEKRVSGGTPDHSKGKAVLAVDIDENETTKAQQDSDLSTTTRFSRQDKGKGIIMDFDASVDLELKLGVPPVSDLNDELQPDLISELQVNAPTPTPALNPPNNLIEEQRMRQHKEIARQNASRFASVSSMDQEGENEADSDPDREAVQQPIAEDWPGPFSTAMKIIRDRKNKGSAQAKHFFLDNSGAPSVIWKPDISQDHHKQKPHIAPSLQDLSMKVLLNNSEAITSLEFVPDVLVHKLVSMLCDNRKMTASILDLLFQGSPSEICIT